MCIFNDILFLFFFFFVFTGAAKKRDVRNLSISPTDLGPPPKTQQTANGSSTRPKPAIITLTRK